MVKLDFIDKIRLLIDKDIIKVITGIRWCGKSYFLNLIIEELKNNGIKMKYNFNKFRIYEK